MPMPIMMLLAATAIGIVATTLNITTAIKLDMRRYIAGQVLTAATLVLYVVGIVLLFA